MLASLQTQLAEIKVKKEEKEKIDKEFTKWRQAFDKAEKTKYSSWKKSVIEKFEEEKKASKEKLKGLDKAAHQAHTDAYSDSFAYLRTALECVNVADKPFFEMRLQRDEISHKSIRPSKTKLAARDLIERGVVRYSDAVHANFCKRVSQVCESNVGGGKEKIPDTVTASDFIGCKLTGVNPFDTFFKDDLFTSLTKADTHAESLAACATDSKAFINWVAAYTKDTFQNEFSPEVVTTIAGLLVELIKRFSLCLSVALNNHSNLQTINAGLVHTLYESIFVLRGADYAPVRSRIDELWASSKSDAAEEPSL
jgi:hypothetical protein